MFRSTDNPTNGRTTDEQLTRIRQLATVALALGIAISALVIGSGAAAAHAGPEDVEDHGYGPGHPLSDDGTTDRERADAEDADENWYYLDSESPSGDSYGGTLSR